MSSIDQQFVEYIVKSLVGHPDDVSIERRIDEKGVLLELTVNPEDLGRVIGKRGATAQSIRSLLRALGTKNDARYNLKIIDNGVGGYNSDSSRREQEQPQDRPVESDEPASERKIVEPAEEQPKEIELDDGLDEEIVIPEKAAPSNVVSKTRKELEELDDLEV